MDPRFCRDDTETFATVVDYISAWTPYYNGNTREYLICASEKLDSIDPTPSS